MPDFMAEHSTHHSLLADETVDWRSLSHFWLGSFLFCFLLNSCSNPNKSANELFVQAAQLIQECENKSETDPETAYQTGHAALDKLNQIVHSYPSSDIAVKLVQGQPVVNQETLKTIQRKIDQLKVATEAINTPYNLLVFVVGQMRDESKASGLAKIAAVLARSGDRKQANVLIDQALGIASNIEGNDKVSDLGEIAIALTLAGNSERAKEVLDQAIALASQIKNEITGENLGRIAFVLFQSGDAAQAKTMIDQAFPTANTSNTEEAIFARSLAMVKKGSALRGLSDALAQEDRTDQALTIANQIEAGSDKALALGKIAVILARAGDSKQAKAVTDQAFDVASKIVDHMNKAQALAQIAIAMTLAGDSERAKEVVDQAITFAGQCEEPLDKDIALHALSVALAQTGNADQATSIANQIQGTSAIKPLVLYDIVVALIESGHTKQPKVMDQCIKTVASISSPSYLFRISFNLSCIQTNLVHKIKGSFTKDERLLAKEIVIAILRCKKVEEKIGQKLDGQLLPSNRNPHKQT